MEFGVGVVEGVDGVGGAWNSGRGVDDVNVIGLLRNRETGGCKKKGTLAPRDRCGRGLEFPLAITLD